MTAPTAAPQTKVIEKPMLFSSAMVRAILDGRKTVTRRVIKFKGMDVPPSMIEFVRFQDGYTDGTRAVFDYEGEPFSVRIPHPVGSRIWVRETWQAWSGGQCDGDWDIRQGAPIRGMDSIEYAATSDSYGPWRPSIHMPRWASRITLEVTDMRVERLQDITPQDAIAEGIERINDMPMDPNDFTSCWRNYDEAEASPYWNSPIDSFRSLWVSINGRDSLKENPFVWVYTFKHLSTEATG